jgi:hypothetical protein
MKWLLVFLGSLLIIAVLAAMINAVGDTRFFLRSRRPSWTRARPQPRCLRCRGTGWINREPERTLNFVGDSFEDRHAPATICPACGGTGVAMER